MLIVLVAAACGKPGETESVPLLVIEETAGGASQPLSGEAQERLLRDGFVILPSVKAPSFHFGYTALFEADQPVYFTADAVLHAVHESFDDILIEVESESLIRELAVFLDELRRTLPGHQKSEASVRADVDLFIAVAKSLLQGKLAAPVAGASPEAIAALTAAATEASGVQSLQLFGSTMAVDLSMLKPRGHYTLTQSLQGYFRALAWLGRIELRLAETGADGSLKLLRGPLAAALLIDEAMSPRAEAAWQRIDRAADLMVGPPDSMSLLAFRETCRRIGLRSETAGRLTDAAVLEALVPVAVQRINTQLVVPGQEALTMWVFGQRYTVDSEVLSATSYGKLPEKRMMPSPLDVAAAVFENPEAHALLAPSYQQFSSLRPAIDGLAKRAETMGPALWQGSLGHLWLSALRALSDRPRNGLPPLMATAAWNRRILNTQLSSWAERRHDMLLYAKQSMTMVAGCSFPRAYVDPYPEFYARLISLAERGHALVDALQLSPKLSASMKAHFERTKSVLTTLRAIAEQERAGRPMSPAHLEFMNKAVSLRGERIGSGWDVAYTVGGWFADLYYNNASAEFHEPTIADVHTQPTDAFGNPVGKVLHVGTGVPQLLEVRIGAQTYRGWISTYHELVTDDFERHDDQWMRQQVVDDALPLEPWLLPYTAR